MPTVAAVHHGFDRSGRSRHDTDRRGGLYGIGSEPLAEAGPLQTGSGAPTAWDRDLLVPGLYATPCARPLIITVKRDNRPAPPLPRVVYGTPPCGGF